MKIALIGSAPSSARLAPYGDPSWQIWGCSPGLYPVAQRIDAWFELHRWEPPVIGKPDQQRPWFSPEYVAWMGQQKLVWMVNPVKEIPNSKELPVGELVQKYGSYFFTSSLAWMFAMALNAIRESGDTDNTIGMWGVDMAASEEYGYQRAGCQFFIQLALNMGIEVIIPPESDLLRPAPLYGICETYPVHIKMLERKRELEGRLAAVRATRANAEREEHFLMGAIDDTTYMMNTWLEEGTVHGVDLQTLLRPAAEVEEKPRLLRAVDED